ncbi:hypothetical protein [Pseudonocardia pini]|uniref:hypothetical protein n=1 Tax=Pseudonocardia pini TaxID=2758030 RepID=UPI0015F06532|nr:hypothetical protein [Pseudonocardia pini]
MHAPHHPHGPGSALPRGRGARTAAVTATALVTAVAGHVLGGAGLPELGAIVLSLLALVTPAWWLARAERGWERLAAAQLTLQLVAHLVFATVGPAAGEHGHGVESGGGPGLVLVAHLVSAAVAAAWLRSGEKRARALSERALRAFLTLLSVWVPGARPHTPARAVPGPSRPDRSLSGVVLRHAIVHRGPPQSA